MSNVAHFVTFKDNPFTLNAFTGPHPFLIDQEIKPLDGVDTTRDAVLAFNLRVLGIVHLTMKFNDNQFLGEPLFQLIPTISHVRHEIFSGSILSDHNNQLAINVGPWAFPGPGQVEFSDFVLTYHVT